MLSNRRQSKRAWRTRRDPFAEVWPEVCRELEADPVQEVKSIFQELQRQFPDRFPNGQLRTLQRRVADWRRKAGTSIALELWTLRLLLGKVDESEFEQFFDRELGEGSVSFLLDCIRHRDIRSRNRAVAVLSNLKGIPISIVCRILQTERKTVCSYLQKFEKVAASGLVDFSRNIVKKADRQDYKDALFAILHEPPSLYGVNRSRWEMADLKGAMAPALSRWAINC